MTKEMLDMEREQEVTDIIATPHFYASEMSKDQFLRHRAGSWDRVQRKLYAGDQAYPPIRMGAEVYYFRDMGRSDLNDLCIEGTRLLLLEMPFAQWTKGVLQDVTDIVQRQELKVIIAHVERFYPYQKDKGIWEEVFRLPLVAQFNAGCLDSWTRRKLPLRFIKTGYPVILGSDCHNTRSRKPNLGEGRRILEKKLGPACLKKIDDLGESLLKEYSL